MAVQDYKINYKSDFVLNINGDAGWAIPFCIKFWTGMPSQAYFVGFDGVKYVNCRVGDTPTQLLVMFDDHHLPIGKLEMQIAYHTTIEEFPGSVFDEVTNARDVIVTIDGTDYQVLLDFTGEDAPELEFNLPAYANEAERIQNELQRQQNEADRIAAELQREQATAAAVQGAENVNAQLSGTTLTVTNRNGVSTSVNTKGERGEQGPVGPQGETGETGPRGTSIVSFTPKSTTATTLIYTVTFSDGTTQDVAIPKGAKGDTGATGPQGPQGDTGVSITGLVKTGETETDTLYNITFSNGTTQQVAIPKGEKGDTGEQGPVGPQGPQGPMGDVAVITPEQQAAFTMYSTTGQNTNGPMTQKAVTDALVIDTAIDIASQYAIQFYLYNNKWHATDQNQFSKHICVAPGQRYRITANASYGVSLYYLHKFAPAANVSATYTQVRLDAGTTTMITIPSDMYHLVFLDNHLQSGGLCLIPDYVELVDDTSSIVVKHSDEIGVLENAALNEVVLGVYGNPDCTKTKKNLKIDGSLLNTTLEGFNVSNFIAIPSGTDYIEYKNVTGNYHDELCGLVVADASNNVIWYNSVSNGIVDLSQYNDAAYIRFMPLYNTSYASIRFIKREPMQGEYVGLELGAFDFSGNLTVDNNRARAIIANPHNILKIEDGYGMFVFAGDENAYPTTLELIANGVSYFDSDTTNYPYLWLMVRDASGTDISLEERDLTEIVSIGGNIPQEIVRSREEIDKFVKLRSCIVDANGGGQFTTISDAVANMPDGSTILIMPGRYEESVHMWGRNLHLVGIDKESCILINGTGNYSTPPLEANIGSVSNMTIIADNYAPTIEDPTINHNSPDYCIHIEQANDSAYQFRVSNCVLNAKWNAAIGLGLRYNQTVIIEDCDIRTECVTNWSGSSNMWIEQGSIFFHNDAVATNNETGHLRVSNCRLRGLKPALSVYNVANHPYAEVEFINNTLISDTYGVGEGIIYRRGQTPSQGYWAGDRITLSIASHGNNISEMNSQ